MNAVTATNEQAKVSEKLLLDYLSTLTEQLNDSQRMQFLAVSQAFNLNPFKREIYAVKYGSNFNIIVGYETYLKRAEEFPQYDGYDIEFGSNGKDISCKCSVYRKDRSHAVVSTVWMSEYNTGKSLWQSKPKVMLEKVAICTAFRRAFPSEYGGMPYTAEELPNNEEINATIKNAETTANDTPLRQFIHKLNAMANEDKDAFNATKEQMKAEGWNKPADVPEARYDEVYVWYQSNRMNATVTEAEIVTN